MQPTMKPSSASDCMSPCAVANPRPPQEPGCGPGYTWFTIGYFFEASKLVGLNMKPYTSVFPSRPFTVIGTGGTHPAATSFVMSCFATSTTTLPVSSRTTADSGCVTVEYTSTK